MSEKLPTNNVHAFPKKNVPEGLNNQTRLELNPERMTALQDFLASEPPTSREELNRTHRAIGKLSKTYLIKAINNTDFTQPKDISARVAVYRAFVEQLETPEEVAKLFD